MCMCMYNVQSNILCLPVILSLEELEFLLDTVQSFQDSELERLARLQGDLEKKKGQRERRHEERMLGCTCVKVPVQEKIVCVVSILKNFEGLLKVKTLKRGLG